MVASGNHATPGALLDALERAVERYRLFMLAAQSPLPVREGVIFETPFVGPGMRDAGEQLDYLPMRLSLVPRLFATIRRTGRRAAAHLTAARGQGLARDRGQHSAGRRRSVRARGGLVIAQTNPHMPYTLGDSELTKI